MKLKKLWRRVRTAFVAGAHAFALWFERSVGPDLVDFLNDNKELAMEVAKDVAVELAGARGGEKRREAVRRIRSELAQTLPELEIDSSWINLLVEIAVAVLGSRGGM